MAKMSRIFATLLLCTTKETLLLSLSWCLHFFLLIKQYKYLFINDYVFCWTCQNNEFCSIRDLLKGKMLVC